MIRVFRGSSSVYSVVLRLKQFFRFRVLVSRKSYFNGRTMKLTIALALALLAGVSQNAFGATEENHHKEFSAKPGGTLVVEVDFGTIEVTGSDTDKAVVDVWRKVTRSKKSAEETYLKEHPVEFSANGDTISILVRGGSGSQSGWLTGRSRNEGTYKISVPSRFNVRVKTGGGGIALKSLEGKANASTSGGAINLELVKGAIDVQTSGGRIEARECDGNIKLRTSGGGLEIAGGSGTLDGETSGGGISLRDFKGPADVSTSGGHIRVANALGTLK